MVRPAIVVLGPSALEVARTIAADVAGEIHGPAGRVEGADVGFGSATAHVAALFRAGRPVIGLCASGILIRAVAPHLGDKQTEPPVVAVAEDGSAVVPLLGGHHGANDLARRIGVALGVAPAITTAGDLRFGVALDAPPDGWTLANPQNAKPVMAKLIAGAAVRVEGDMRWLSETGLSFPAHSGARGNSDPEAALSRGPAAVGSAQPVVLRATERAEGGGPDRLIYHPRILALGVGCERGCAPEELIALAEETLIAAGLARQSVALVASLDLKADEPAVHALADQLGVPARFFDAATLDREAPRLMNPSEAVRREVGCPGVAEGAALAAAGPQGQLVVGKTKSQRATCAVARAPAPIDVGSAGCARGRLSVVGLGPGDAAWRSPEAERLLNAASDWVGYGLYLDLAAALAHGKAVHRYDLGAEEARVRHALALAGQGRDVALLCSGDAGIYAMAALVFELLEGLPDGDPARRAEIVVAPGISAFQAAAARAGALIGHDFCAISLSDLLTPWPVIEARTRAAADGDFVVAFYNPRSRNRRDHLGKALSILRRRRPPETPVVVASNLGRPEEEVEVTSLENFDASGVDMLTVVLVGSADSRTVTTRDGKIWAYTPRGYAAKRRAAE